MKICKVEGCDKESKVKGVCNAHYKRFRRHGSYELQREQHRMKYTKEYNAWRNIKDRCRNKNHWAYEYYGARGIDICDEWYNSFEAFYEGLGDIPDGLSIDRINNDKGYEPGNIRFANKTEQCTNRRKFKNNTSGYTGVSFSKKKGKWLAYIDQYGKRKILGVFKEKSDAIKARKKAEQKLK